MRAVGWLAATHLAVFGIGWFLAPKDPLDTEVEHTGFFQVDTRNVLAATVESLREENKLLVFSHNGTATVRATRKILGGMFKGEQVLIVPAVVSYYLDLSDLSLADVRYDEPAKLVIVKLPKVIMGDVAFQPENATTINGGILTFDDDQVEALRKLNYAAARRAMVKQAQQPGVVNVAKRQAIRNVENYFSIPLRIAGTPDVKVAATFN